MKFLFFSNTPVSYLKSEHKVYVEYANLIDFIFELSKEFHELHLCLPCKNVAVGQSDIFSMNVPANVKILPLTYYRNEYDLISKLPRILLQTFKVFKSAKFKEYRGIGMVAPGFISLFATIFGTVYTTAPMYYLIRGNKVRTVRHMLPSKSLKASAAVLLAKILTRTMTEFQKRLNITTFAIGDRRSLELGKNKDVFTIAPMIDECQIEKRAPKSNLDNILFVGRLSAEKGIADIIEGFRAHLRDQNENARLHIVGEGDQEKKLKDLVSDYNLTQNVIFYGFVPRGPLLWDIFRKCDVFILSSYTEGLPRALFEAMSMGLVIVTTKVGGIGTFVQDRVNGLIIEPSKPESIRDALEVLSKEKQLTPILVKNGYVTAREVTFSEQAKKMSRIIKGLAPS